MRTLHMYDQTSYSYTCTDNNHIFILAVRCNAFYQIKTWIL